MGSTKLARIVLGAIVGVALAFSAIVFTDDVVAEAAVGSHCVLECTPVACCTIDDDGTICDCVWKDDEEDDDGESGSN